MSIKKQVISKAVQKIKSRLVRINLILNATPLSDICRGRIDAAELIRKKDITNKDKLKIIRSLAAKEKESFKIAKKQQRSSFVLIREKNKLVNELNELTNELYWIRQKIKRINERN